MTYEIFGRFGTLAIFAQSARKRLFCQFDTPRTKSQTFWSNLILKSWKIGLFLYGESEKIGPETIYQSQRGGEQEGVVVLLTT